MSTEVGALVLGKDLCVRRVNLPPEAGIDLGEWDKGCPIGEVKDRLSYDALSRDAQWVLDEGAVIEREIRHNGRTYRVRIAPARPNSEGTAEGVKVTFVEETDQEDAEEELRQLKERLQVALDAAEMGTWQWDLDARTVRGDVTFMDMFDLPPTDQPVPAETFLEKQSERDADAVERVMQTDFEPGEYIQDVIRLDHVEDAPVWVEWRGQARESDPSVLVGVSFDITERKRRERNLSFLADVKDDLARLTGEEEIIQTVGGKLGDYADVDMVYIAEVDEDTGEARTAHLWKTEEAPDVPDAMQITDFLGERAYREAQSGELIVVHDTETDPRTDTAAYRALGIRSGVAVPFVRQGQLKFALCIANANPREWRDDEIEVFEDVADRLFPRVERSRAEQALEESERRLQLATDVGGIGVWELDRQSDMVVYQSPQFSQIYGYDEPLEGWNIERVLEHVPPEERDRLTAKLEEGLEAGAWEHEFQIVTADDERRWVVTRGKTYGSTEDEDAPRALGTIQDITDRKRREQNASFVAELTDILSRRSGAGDIMAAAGEQLGAFLDLDRCRFIDIGDTAGSESVAYDWHDDDLSDTSDAQGQETGALVSPALREAVRGEETVVVDDVRTDERVNTASADAPGVRSFVVVPVLWNKEVVFAVCVSDTTPRSWRTDEVDLVEEVATRIWLHRERARTAAALRESEARLNAVLEQLPVGVGMVDAEGQWVLKNPALEEYVPGAMPSQDPDGHVHWKSWADDERRIEPAQWPGPRALRGETVSPGMDFLYTPPEGPERWVRVSAAPFRNAEDDIVGAVVVVEDIHERKKAQQELEQLTETLEDRVEARTKELHRREQEFRALVDASASIVWWANPDGRIVEDSPAWRAFTGQREDELKGTGWSEAVHPEDREGAQERWAEAIEEETPFEDEYRLYHAESDSYRWTQARAVPLYDADGAVRGWIGMNVDIDRRKRTQKQLVALAEELEERVEMRTEQVRELSAKLTLAEQRERHRLGQVLHEDLQQRLYGLQLRLDALPRYLEAGDAESLVDQVEAAKTGLEEAITTTRQLSVDLSPPVLEDEGIVAALEWLQTHMEDLHDLEVELQADREEVPVHAEPVRVLLFQVVRELLLNVAEHAEVQRATVNLRVEAGDLIIVVADEGRGFALNASADAEEMGFGLTSIRKRIAFLGGDVTVDTSPGQGTRVTVEVPVRMSTATAVTG